LKDLKGDKGDTGAIGAQGTGCPHESTLFEEPNNGGVVVGPAHSSLEGGNDRIRTASSFFTDKQDVVCIP
jgi:hypothetical protein